MLKAIDVDPDMVLCDECCGDQGHEEITDVCGGTRWVVCDSCHGSGQVPDDRPECEYCGDHTDEEKLVEMPGGKWFCPSCAEAVSD